TRSARTVVRLDRPAEASVVRADPDAALSSLIEPILIDEWQEVPEVLGAIKRAVDSDSHPGRFLVTGSIRARFQRATWAGTGRLIQVTLQGMSIREQLGKVGAASFFDRLVDSEADPVPNLVSTQLLDVLSPLDIRDYLDMALRGGFPEAVHLATERLRRLWLE
ncbi:AAA family ATPase, partial [mine drainage metagenome]